MRITVRKMLWGLAALILAVVSFSLHAYRQRPEAIDAAFAAQHYSPLLAIGDVVDRGPSVLETIGFGLHAATRWVKGDPLVLREERDLLLPPKPGAPTDLVVHVSDEDGVPQPGAVVAVFAQAGVSQPRDGLTDAEGRIRFAGLPAAEGYVVDVGVPTLRVRTYRVVHLTPGRTAALHLRLRAAGRYVGTVTWADDGRPAPSATVVLRRSDLYQMDDVRDVVARRMLGTSSLGEVVAQTRADEQGRFSLDLPHAHTWARLYFVTAADAQAEGVVRRFASLGGAFFKPPENDLLRLRPVPWVEGRVQTAVDGPVAGAVLRAAGVDPGAPSGIDALPTTVSDGEGRFRLLVPHRYPYGNERPFAVSLPRGPTFIVGTTAATSCDVELPHEITVRVLVVDVADGRPIPGANVLVEAESSDDQSTYVKGCLVRAGADGVAHLPTAPGAFEVRASAAGYIGDSLAQPHEGLLGRAALLVRAGRVASVTVPLVRAAPFDVVGRLLHRTDTSVDRLGRTVWSMTGASSVAPDGRFRLEGVRNQLEGPQAWGARVEVRGPYGAPTSVHVAAPKVGAPSIVDLGDLPSVERLAYLVGRVVDDTGRPVVGASGLMGTTDEHGWYGSGVPYRALGGFSMSKSAPGLLADEVQVSGVLREGEVRQVRTQVLRRPSVLRFTVFEANGSPAVGAVVSFPKRDQPSPVEREVGADGTVEGRWAPGEEITLRTADGASFTARRAARDEGEAKPSVLRFPSRRVVHGVVVAPDGRGIANAEISFRSDHRVATSHPVTLASKATTAAEGRFTLAVSGEPVALKISGVGYHHISVEMTRTTPLPLRVVVTPIPDAALDRAEALQREGIEDLIRLRRGELSRAAYEEREGLRREELRQQGVR